MQVSLEQEVTCYDYIHHNWKRYLDNSFLENHDKKYFLEDICFLSANNSFASF